MANRGVLNTGIERPVGTPPSFEAFGSGDVVDVESIVEERRDTLLPLVGMRGECPGVCGVSNDPHVHGLG